WIEFKGGKLRLIKRHAETVRLMFRLAAQGFGYAAIVKHLTAEKVPPWGTSGHWVRTTVRFTLTRREALGEYQPRKRVGGKKTITDGAPIVGYYPAAVSEDEWHAAQQSNGKGKKRPRLGKHLELFPRGMLRDAQGGGTYTPTTRVDGGVRARVLVPADSV